MMRQKLNIRMTRQKTTTMAVCTDYLSKESVADPAVGGPDASPLTKTRDWSKLGHEGEYQTQYII